MLDYENRRNKNRMNAKQKLTVKQKRLIEELAKPKVKSIKDAAIKAGYADSTANTHVYAMLENASFSAALEERKQRVIAHHEITPEEVLGSAVFQMRSSMADILNDEGSFDYEKARATGVIDLLKKHKETIRVVKNKNTTETIKTIEVELLTNQGARKEVAEYLGIKQLPRENEQNLKRTIAAIEHYMRDNPTADKEWVIKEFAQGRNVPIEQIYKHFGINKVS